MSIKKSEIRETVYSSKEAAIIGMWRYYNSHIRYIVGNPLVGDKGTVLQWCNNGKTEYMTVTTGDQNRNLYNPWLLIKSWIER
jgi:hypothetical protein